MSLLAEKGGVLSVQATNNKRHLVALAAGVSMIAAPLALLGNGAAQSATSAHSSRGQAARASTGGSSRGVELKGLQLTNDKVVIPTTTTTTPPPPPAPAPTTTTTSAPARPVYVAPPTTTTTLPRTSATGIATWYGTSQGHCASQVAPRGAIITVSSANASISCLVDDYEAAGAPHVVDLSEADFTTLAGSPGVGSLSVTISW